MQASAAKQTVRKDPAPRGSDGVGPVGLGKQHPDYEYVMVGNTPDQIAMYQDRGFEVAHKTGDGVILNGDGSKGSTVEYKDTIVMLRSKEQRDEEYRRGQEAMDKIERRIITKRTGFDPLRGINDRARQYVSADMEVSNG